MLKNKLFFLNFFIFAFYFESFAMKENNDLGNSSNEEQEKFFDDRIRRDNNLYPPQSSNNTQMVNNLQYPNQIQNAGTGPLSHSDPRSNSIPENTTEEIHNNISSIPKQNIDMIPSMQGNLNNSSSIFLQKNKVDPFKKGKVNYFLVPGSDKPLTNFNKLVHIFFYFIISPLLNVNNLEWRHYFFQGQLNRGGVFFYYGLLNFGIGFNRKTFWDTCSCRIIGLNLFQFLGSFVLYFFVDQHENIKTRWNKKGGFPFFLFNATYFEEYIGNIDSESEIPDIVREGSFMAFISYSFAIFPFLSFFTFDFQLFEYLTFSLNIGSFLFLTVAFSVYTFYKHTGKPFGNISGVVNKYDNTFKDFKKIELDTISSLKKQ